MSSSQFYFHSTVYVEGGSWLKSTELVPTLPKLLVIANISMGLINLSDRTTFAQL